GVVVELEELAFLGDEADPGHSPPLCNTVSPSDGAGTLVADGARYPCFPGISGHRAATLRQPGGVGVREGARLLRNPVVVRAAHLRARAGGGRPGHRGLRARL